MNPKISVMIVQWGKTDLTVRAIAAVRRSDYPGPMEFLVYDNASPEGPGTVVDLDGVDVVLGDMNLGFGRAHNILAHKADGDLLLILNNDTLIDPRALGRLVERHESGEPVGTVTPHYRSFQGKTLEMGGFLGPGGEGWQLFRGMRPPDSLTRMAFSASYGSAACLLVGRQKYLELGGFDDLFSPAYYEDTDLCMKLAAKGLPSVVEPTAIVYHYEGATAGRDTTSRHKAFQVRNRSRFVERWHRQLAEFQPMSLKAALSVALEPGTPDAQRILWLSPHIPRPDREAGHARMMNMITALSDAGERVVLWAERCEDADHYGRLLEAIDVPWFGPSMACRWGPRRESPAFSSAEELLEAVRWDVVVISFPTLASRMISAVRRLRPHATVLIDDVDLHFLRDQRAQEAGIDAPVVIPKETELATYAASDGVITASSYESVVLDQELRGIPSWAFTVAAQPPLDHPDQGCTNLLFLGNFNHHPNVDLVDWWIEELGHKVAERAGRPLRLRVVGTGSDARAQDWLRRGSGLLDIVGWVPDLVSEFAAARVFLAPLRYGAGTKGKILAALAHGIPVVTTSIGAEGNMKPVLDALLVADDGDELAEIVAELMTDDDAWHLRRSAAVDAGCAAWKHQQAATAEFAAWVRRRGSRIKSASRAT